MRKTSTILFLFFSLCSAALQAAETGTAPAPKQPATPEARAKIEAVVAPYVSAYKEDHLFATVNGKPVLFSEFKILYKKMLENYMEINPDKPLTQEMVKEICIGALDRQTKKRALEDEVEKRKLYPADPELDDQFQKVKMQYGVYFSQFLNSFKIKEEDYRGEIKFRMAAAKLMGEFDKTAVLPEEKDAETWYNSNKQKFLVPRQIKFSIICMNHPENADKETADNTQKRLEELRAEIVAGKRPFEEAARNFSDEPNSRKNGGNVGPVYVKDIKKDFVSLGTLKLNELSPVTVYPQGFFIARVTQDIPESTMEFASVKDKIFQALKMEKLQKHRQQCLDTMLKDAKVEIKETSLLPENKAQK